MEVVKDQRADAMKYLEKHKILKLFDILGAKLVKRKPTFPNEFLVSELETILEAKTMSNPVLVLHNAYKIYLSYRNHHHSVI